MARATPESCSFPLGDLHSHVIHGSLGPPASSSRTACGSVQPFLHSSSYSVPLVYNAPPRSHLPLKNRPFPLGDRVPHRQRGSCTAHPRHHPKRHVDRFSHFCMGPKCYAAQCIVNGKTNLPLPLGILPPCRRRIEPRP